MKKPRNTNKNKFIPVNRPALSKQSKKQVQEALETGWLSASGPMVKDFEEKFSSYVGVEHGVCVSSGTAALHVTLLSLDVGKGDEVIVPAFTMAATWLPVLYVGAKPVFVDCEIDTFNIKVSDIEKKITPKTKAIMAVHVYGQPCDMDEINALAKKYDLYVIEDAAEAHGAQYKNKTTGSLGDIGCFSFYANKIISTGEGGMIVTNNAEVAKHARNFRNLYHSEEKRFIHEEIGYNYRFTNLQAAVGVGELESIEKYLKKKARIAQLYSGGLEDIPGITPPRTKSNRTNVYWMFGILIDKDKYGVSRDKLREILEKDYNIETRDFFYGPHKQPVVKHLVKKEAFPNTNHLSKNGLYLPSGLATNTNEIRYVIKSLKKIHSSS